MKGRVKNARGNIINIHIDSERFSASVHAGLSCTDCHAAYTSGPHMQPAGVSDPEMASLLPFVSIKSKIDPSAQAACSKCHPVIYETYKASVHGENIFKKREKDGPLCLDCHGTAHYIMPKADAASTVNHANVLQTCGRCHEEKEIIEKYNLSAHVIEKYKESFHGKKYMLGHKKVPICNDCHGSHVIMRVDAPGSPVSGEGKVKTCGRCHKGATAKFAAAPAHKYIGKENPIPFWGEKALIVLLLGVFLFIISHVLLEAYSELRDNVLSKKEEDDNEK
jgi:nitrate/TMAO reductase-like tetraheme cytochrome c subunit